MQKCYGGAMAPDISPLYSISGTLVNEDYGHSSSMFSQKVPPLSDRVGAIPILAIGLVEVVFRVFTSVIMGLFSQITRYIPKEKEAANRITETMDRIGYQGLLTTFHSIAFCIKCIFGQNSTINKSAFNHSVNNILDNKHLVRS